jgi:hypothetical protein
MGRTEGRSAVSNGTGKQHTEKTPTGPGRGSVHASCRPFPSQGRLSARQGRSPDSRPMPTLCAFPRAHTLSGFGRFRSAHSCGAAMDFHHLPWSQSLTMTNPTSDMCNFRCELMTVLPGLSSPFTGSALSEHATGKRAVDIPLPALVAMMTSKVLVGITS